MEKRRSGSRYAPPKRRRRKRHGLLLGFVFVFVALVAACVGGFMHWRRSLDAAPAVSVDLAGLYSPHATLLDASTGTVLGDKDGEEMIYPASMTKVLSVWVAIENIKDLDAETTLSAEIYDELYAEGASQAGFVAGETTTIRELLYGALLPSGAECCLQLAIEAAGSEEGLVELMNAKVEKLGLTGSHFANCTGLHSDDQYTSTYEMALIVRAALQNETFREVYTTHYHVMAGTDVHPDGFTVWSTFFKNVADEVVTGGEILGAKTGYTSQAGLCLCSMAQIGEREYILVTAGWASEDVASYHILDAYTGYNLLGEALGYGEGVEE